MALDTKQLQQITILYVEDDKIVRLQTEKILEKLFKKVYIALDGQDGLAQYKENINDIDIVVSDINMPKMNGFEMIKEILNLKKSIPTIITTAHSDSANLQKAIDINIDKYITKPIQVKELTVAIVDLVMQYKRSNNIENLAKTLVQKTTQNDKANDELTNEVEFLRKQNVYLNSIVNNMVLNLKISKSGKITYVSNKFNSFFGYTNIVGENISVLRCDTCDQETFQKLMLKAIHTKKMVVSHYTLITNEDRRVNTEVTMAPFYNQDALVDGYEVYIDIL